ncbi:MAG TPA: alpha/beta fold hydrolase [Myxococcota bacterium]
MASGLLAALLRNLAPRRRGDAPGPEVFARFEAVASQRPDQTAIEHAGAAIRYGELLERARAIADRLPAARGLRRARVALLFDDRIHAIASILGVLRAGHAFVPLDPADPRQRNRLILRDSEPVALLTDSAAYFRARKLRRSAYPLINIEEPEIRRRRRPQRAAGAGDLAYLFYTSGSTGEPKGVCQTHRNLLHFVGCYSRGLAISASDRLSLLYTLSFSAANMDIFGGLLAGATVCAYDMRTRGLPELADWIDSQRISVLHAVPSLFRKLLDSLAPGRVLGSVRAVDLGGEAVTRGDAERFREHFRRDCLLVNHLAATEASVIAQYAVPPDGAEDGEALPAGFAPDGVEVRIERPDGTPAAPGEVGRMVVASPYLSPGYWRRRKLTSEAFRPDPSRPGWRCYRSSDLASIDAAGLVRFVGREGTRVKIRGHSVDLAEVEAALRECPGIRDAVVVPGRRSARAEPEAELLVAHVVSDAPSTASALRRELRESLPHYMLPAAFAFHPALPLTASGKLDRRAAQALPIPDEPAGADDDAPRDAVESQVARIFAHLLARESNGRSDDFFLCGGDSMSAVQLQVLLCEAAGLEVRLTDIFEDPTVSGLAALLRRLAKTPGASSLPSLIVPLREEGSRPALFLLHGAQGQANVSPQFLEALGDDLPVYALQARGLDGTSPPNPTLEAMAEDYLAAIRSVQPAGPYFLGGLCSGAYVAMLMTQRLEAEGESVLPLLLIDPPGPPFKPTTAPPGSVDPRAAVEHEIQMELRMRQELGCFNLDLGDTRRREASVRVVLAFEQALAAHHPEPFDGPVHLLLSSEFRAMNGWQDPAAIRMIFAGPLEIREISKTHGEIVGHRGRQALHSEIARSVGEILRS